MVENCIRVPKQFGSYAIRLISSRELLADAKPIVDGTYLLIPTSDPKAALSLLQGKVPDVSECSGNFKFRRRTSRLSDEVGGVSGFLKIGRIVLFSYNHSIGFNKYVEAAAAVADMYGGLESVFLKLGTTGELRLPELVLLYGSGSTLTDVRESGLTFRVDVAKTYFNPRLSGERLRIAELAKDDERILDMFSGVAPFSLVIASRRRVKVVANDLNPYAAALAAINVRVNLRRLKGEVKVVRSDANLLPRVLSGAFDRIIMNNPTASLKFLATACALAADVGFLHVYVLYDNRSSVTDAVLSALPTTCRADVLGVRRALEYSPSRSVFAVDLQIRKTSQG